MKRMITAVVFVLYTIGVTAVYAGGGHSNCAEKYSASKQAGKGVAASISS